MIEAWTVDLRLSWLSWSPHKGDVGPMLLPSLASRNLPVETHSDSLSSLMINGHL